MAGFSFFSDLITPTKYKVPDWQAIDPTQVQGETVAGNLTTLAGAKNLATDYNAFMRQQQQQALEAGIPGYAKLTSQLAANLGEGMAGKLSLSDAAASQRASAARGLGLGLGGGGAFQNLVGRDLGLTQYQVQQQAQSQVPGFLATMRQLTASPTLDPASMFFSPQQRLATAFQNQSNQWQVANVRNQMAAQPAPWMRALAGLGDSAMTAAAGYFTMNPGFGGGGRDYTMQDWSMQNQELGNSFFGR